MFEIFEKVHFQIDLFSFSIFLLTLIKSLYLSVNHSNEKWFGSKKGNSLTLIWKLCKSSSQSCLINYTLYGFIRWYSIFIQHDIYWFFLECSRLLQQSKKKNWWWFIFRKIMNFMDFFSSVIFQGFFRQLWICYCNNIIKLLKSICNSI